MQKRNTNHILLCLACEEMVFGVMQFQRKNWIRQPKKEWCTRVRQPMKELCTGVGQLPLKDLCVGIRQLQIRVRQLLADGCYSLELGKSQLLNIIESR
jgi:hypothetical protein